MADDLMKKARNRRVAASQEHEVVLTQKIVNDAIACNAQLARILQVTFEDFAADIKDPDSLMNLKIQSQAVWGFLEQRWL